MLYTPQNTLPGNEALKAGSDPTLALAMLQMDVASGRLPSNFPIHEWHEQKVRYDYYWSWATGTILEEVAGKTKEGKTVYRYPLKINPVRNFARKHAALLFGEVPDTPAPLVKTLITPKTIYGNPTERSKEDANFCAGVVNEVWQASNGRSIQYENGDISQWLGGSVFEISYVPWRRDLLIPITVRNISPDFVLPIFNADNYYDLSEAWIVYYVSARAAEAAWGIKPKGSNPNVLYVSHWTKDYNTRTVDGEILEARYPNGVRIRYDRHDNPFGQVPIKYTPRLREGSPYGSSFIPDIAGLALEYNSRLSDVGDAMRKTVHQRYVGRNITGSINPNKPLDDRGNTYLDIGVQNPALDGPPELKPLDPPKWSDSFSSHQAVLWNQLLREGGLGPIAFGEDEGSQRSALTLAFRMWPSTIVAKAQRTFWTDGLNEVAKVILTIAAEKNIRVSGQTVPKNFQQLVDISQDWLPMVPRDREAQVSEVVALVQSGLMSPETALGALGNVPDAQQELLQIKEHLEYRAKLNMKTGNEFSQAGEGAAVDIEEPTVSSGLREDE